MKTKICSFCKKIKSVKDFYPHKRHKDKLTDCCKSCGKFKSNRYYTINKMKVLQKAQQRNKKLTTKQRERRKKYTNKYYKENIEEMRKQKREYARKWRKNNPDKDRINRLKRKYNLTPEDIMEMLRKQNNKCAICNKFLSYYVIDHNHKTGKVRGLLCCSCNTAIGKFKDSISQLQKAIKYLRIEELKESDCL